MNKNTFAKWVTAAAILGIAAYIYIEWDEFSTLRVYEPAYIGLVVLAVLTNLIVTSLIHWRMLRKLTLPISLVEAISLGLLTTVGNIIGPFRGGAALRAVYLKTVYGFEFSRFMSTLYGVYVVTVGVNAAVGLVAVGLMGFQQTFAGLVEPVIALLGCLAVCLLAALTPRVNSTGGWLSGRIASASDGWHSLRSDFGVMASVIALTLVQSLSGIVALWGCFAALGVQPAALPILVVGTIGNLSTMLSITPAGIGVYDGVVAYIATKTSIAPQLTVAAALFMRIILLASVIPLCVPAGIWLSRKFGGNLILRPKS